MKKHLKEMIEILQTLDVDIVKTIISSGCNRSSSIPEIPPQAISVATKNHVVDSTMKLSKQDWKKEQQASPHIGPVITLINKKAHLQHVLRVGDPSGMKVLLKFQKDLMTKGG